VLTRSRLEERTDLARSPLKERMADPHRGSGLSFWAGFDRHVKHDVDAASSSTRSIRTRQEIAEERGWALIGSMKQSTFLPVTEIPVGDRHPRGGIVVADSPRDLMSP